MSNGNNNLIFFFDVTFLSHAGLLSELSSFQSEQKEFSIELYVVLDQHQRFVFILNLPTDFSY
jgi:hypothetical protein